MKEKVLYLVLPDQLFYEVGKLGPENADIMLYEAPAYFTAEQFHKHKLTLHRASMQALRERLLVRGYRVEYETWEQLATWPDVFAAIQSQGWSTVTLYEIENRVLAAHIEEVASEFAITILWRVSPKFILTSEQVVSVGYSDQGKDFERFYLWLRRHLGLLVDGNGEPEGGRWLFDYPDREILPSSYQPFEGLEIEIDRYLEEAFEYIGLHFEDNPGELTSYSHPFTYDDAQATLENFIRDALPKYELYSRSISDDFAQLHHSRLSGLLNVGLLTPREVLAAIRLHRDFLPDSAVELFIRGLVGKREWMRFLGVSQLSKIECSEVAKQDPRIELTGLYPLDLVLRRTLENAYLHETERLLAVVSMRLVGETEERIEKWLLTHFVDAYPWTVKGSLIQIEGRLFDSSWVSKISNVRDEKWKELWDALLWQKIQVSGHQLALDPAIRSRFESISEGRKVQLNQIADTYYHA